MIILYITIRSVRKTLGKYVEMQDLYVGLPILFIFLILFSFTSFKLFALVFFTIGAFLMIPISASKKNRMYKVFGMLILYLFRVKDFTYEREENSNG